MAKNGDVFDVLWEVGDELALYPDGQSSPEIFVLSDGDGTACGTFVGDRVGDKNIIFYPYKYGDYADSCVVHTDFAEEQKYFPGCFDRSAFYMTSIGGESQSFSFKNLCAVIKVSVTGKYSLTSLSIIAHDKDVFLSGPAEVTIEKDSQGMKILKDDSGHAINQMPSHQDRVTIICNNVQLDEYSATDFYFVLPPVELRGGFSIVLKSAFGSLVKNTSADVVLKSSTLYSVPCFNFNLFDGASPTSSLEGYGTEESPFHISSCRDLLALQNAVNSKSTIVSSSDCAEVDAATASYVLDNDIDLSEICGEGIANWSPIGYMKPDNFYSYYSAKMDKEPNPFKGVFDGCGYKISGLYLDDEELNNFGLFGAVDGTVRNLTVEGFARGCYNIALLATFVRGNLINCTSIGKIQARTAAGLVCNSYDGVIDGCINYADICCTCELDDPNDLSQCSGIIREGVTIVKDCVNYGKLTDFRDVGGISVEIEGKISDQNNYKTAKVYNCANYGSLSGVNVGGVVQTISVGTHLANCLNAGDLKGIKENAKVGGIVMQSLALGNNCPENFDETHLDNCVSIGKISCDYPTDNCGAIFVSSTSDCSNCYWLKDCCAKAFSQNTGYSSSIISLDSDSMKEDSDTGIVLYGQDDKGYSILLDALNAWAYDHYSVANEFCGWSYVSNTSFPSLTYQVPTYPGEPSYSISINVKSVQLSHKKKTFTVEASSRSPLTVSSLPDWTKLLSTKEKETGGMYRYQYTFYASANDSGSKRSGEISFTNSDGLSVKLMVSQGYAYCSKDYSLDGSVTCHQSASVGKGIDVVILGDGYSDRQIAKGQFSEDVDRALYAFFSKEPYTTFRNYFNVYSVVKVSENESFGADFSTALDGYFGDGTVVGGNINLCLKIAAQTIGKDDVKDALVIVIMNSYRYSGTCYWYNDYSNDYGSCSCVSFVALGTTSTGMTGFEAILCHESNGHAFAKLLDEYFYDYMGEINIADAEKCTRDRKDYGVGKNVDFTPDPFKVCWSHFLTDSRYDNEGLGVFEGANTYSKGAYRPTDHSIMRYNTGHFNAPSREAIYYRIHKLAFGNQWNYDYEEFVKYDAINRSGTKTSTSSESTSAGKFQHLHAPVILESTRTRTPERR